MSSRRTRMLLAGIGTAGVLGLTAGAALAAPTNGGTEQGTFPAKGAVFQCSGPTGDITATGGNVYSVFHWNVDQNGVFHGTGTIVPQNDVVLEDAHGDSYTISGAGWFGAKGTDPNAPVVMTDTEHFVLHNTTSGGTLRVQVVTHLSPNGNFFSFDGGACEPPVG